MSSLMFVRLAISEELNQTDAKTELDFIYQTQGIFADIISLHDNCFLCLLRG